MSAAEEQYTNAADGRAAGAPRAPGRRSPAT